MEKTGTTCALALAISLMFGISGLAAGQASSKPASKPAAKHPWASFNPGAWVKIKSFTVADPAGGKATNVIETKITLLEKTSDKVVLETAMTVMGQTTTTKADMPLKGYTSDVPEGVKVLKTGSETITIGTKPVACETMESAMDMGGAKILFKRWTSAQVPGSLVKSVTTRAGSRATAEVVEFNVP